VNSNFEVDTALLEDFKQYAKAEIPRYDEAGFQSDLEFIRAMVRFEINRALFGMAEARRHLLSADPQAKLAISLFSEAETLNRNARGRKRVAAR
jgi:hypothetical protein